MAGMKYLVVGAITLCTAVTFMFIIRMNTFLTSSLSFKTSIPVVGDTKYAIFYNAYVNPDNVYLSLGVIGEQLAQWKASRYANATLFYTHLGDVSKTFPCPANGNCTLLNVKPSGGEEETLGPLHEFCHQNPEYSVIYLHSKGSFHPNVGNDRLRNLITLAALSDECNDGLHTGSQPCNICSARFSPIPHWHSPGNMWIAKCSYIQNLLPIANFTPKVAEIVQEYLTNCTYCPDWSIGTNRYANEHWAYTHPQVQPCDLYTDLSYDAGYPNLPNDILPPFSLAIAPRNFTVLTHLVLHDLQPLPGPQVKLSYRLYELEQLYGMVPANDSFAWTWYEQQEQDLL